MKSLLAAIVLMTSFSSFASDPTFKVGEIVSIVERREMDGVKSYGIGIYRGINKYGLHPAHEITPVQFYAPTGEWVGTAGTKEMGVFRSPTYTYNFKNHDIGQIVKSYLGFERGDQVTVHMADDVHHPNKKDSYKAEILDVFSNGVVALKFVDQFKRVRATITTFQNLGLEDNYEN